MSVASRTAGAARPQEHDHHDEEFRRSLMLDPIPQEEMNDKVVESLHRVDPVYLVVMGLLGLIALVGLAAWGYQIIWGMGAAGLRRPVFWGTYIATFVFWVGISHSGTFVSAILRVFKVEHRRPFTRMAEMMTSASLILAILFIAVHAGRTWRGYFVLPYPNQRSLWSNFHSALLWDTFALMAYLIGSTLYLYLPLIPDLAMVRDRTEGWRRELYRILSLGWRGTQFQWQTLHRIITIFSFVIIPVMFSVHTIVSWDFAMSRVIGWRSSIFGPYFVAGAIFSGVSAVVNILFLVRYNMKLHYFIREEHFDALAKLILIFSFVWTYFFFSDFLVEWYGGDSIGHTILAIQTDGAMRPFWLIMIACNIVLPWLTLWSRKIRRSPIPLFVIALAVNIGMYLERYIIVTGFQRRNRLPFNWGEYAPSLTEFAIVAGSVAAFLFIYGLLTRILPIIPVWEVKEGQVAHQLRRIGRTKVKSVSELE
jgi:molybdopterin-containing oxidoreductase family membrane subunit